MLKVFKEKNLIKIINNSDFILEVHLVPKKPKRKVFFEIMIHPKQWFVSEKYDFDIENYFFRFVRNK